MKGEIPVIFRQKAVIESDCRCGGAIRAWEFTSGRRSSSRSVDTACRAVWRKEVVSRGKRLSCSYDRI